MCNFRKISTRMACKVVGVVVPGLLKMKWWQRFNSCLSLRMILRLFKNKLSVLTSQHASVLQLPVKICLTDSRNQQIGIKILLRWSLYILYFNWKEQIGFSSFKMGLVQRHATGKVYLGIFTWWSIDLLVITVFDLHPRPRMIC